MIRTTENKTTNEIKSKAFKISDDLIKEGWSDIEVYLLLSFMYRVSCFSFNHHLEIVEGDDE